MFVIEKNNHAEQGNQNKSPKLLAERKQKVRMLMFSSVSRAQSALIALISMMRYLGY